MAKKLKDRIIDKMIDEMTKVGNGKVPTVIGANSFRMELTKKNWEEFCKTTEENVANYYSKKNAS